MRLQTEHYRLLAALRRQPSGPAFLALLQAALDEAHAGLRTATGEKLGWLQGEAQCLERWLREFAEAERLGR